MKRSHTSRAGFTLIEVLVSLVIFGLISAAIYSAYYAQVKQTTRQYKFAKASMDIQIGKNLIERDITMAGFGLAENFEGHSDVGNLAAKTRAIGAVNGVASASDQMTIMGTALGITTRYSQGWTVVKTDPITSVSAPVAWTDDPRDALQSGTYYVAMDPFGRKLSNPWVGQHSLASPATLLPQGTLLYALSGTTVSTSSTPYYGVKYYLDLPRDVACAPGAMPLRRLELRSYTVAGTGSRIVNCALNMQVAFGLDQTDPPDEVIDLWDNGGVQAAVLSRENLNKQLKQVRVYVLSQASERDDNYQSPSPIRVGEADLGTGADVTLDLVQNQEKYRWNLLTMVVTPRNMR